jgi:hypothetical protein
MQTAHCLKDSSKKTRQMAMESLNFLMESTMKGTSKMECSKVKDFISLLTAVSTKVNSKKIGYKGKVFSKMQKQAR